MHLLFLNADGALYNMFINVDANISIGSMVFEYTRNPSMRVDLLRGSLWSCVLERNARAKEMICSELHYAQSLRVDPI